MYRAQFDAIWRDDTAVLSAPDSYTLEYFPPPAALASLITTFYFFHSDEHWLRDCQPASTGYMMIFLTGESQVRFASGLMVPSQPVSLIGPTNAAVQYVIKGPLTVVGCSFTPLGWRALTGASAREGCDRFTDSQTLFGPAVDDFHQKIGAAHASGPNDNSRQALTDMICGFLMPRLSVIPARHSEIVAAVLRWLDQSITPDVGALYAHLPIARRQAQRIIGDYFGCAPKHLMRKYRAIRAAMLLNDPACSDEQAMQVQELFYDQPHMIREIRHFVGRTPSRLSGADGTLLSMWLDKENIRELRR